MSKKHLKLTPAERILRSKADIFIKAEKEYWKHRNKIDKEYAENASALGLPQHDTAPDNLSSIVWAMQDGVAFVRFQDKQRPGSVDFRCLGITLEQWGQEGLWVPIEGVELSLARIGLTKGLSNITIRDCKVNDIHIAYVEFRHAFYDDEQMPSAIERAIIDFQLTLLGSQLQQQPLIDDAQENSSDKTIQRLEEIAICFQELLESPTREEDLQIFLKTNPLVLHPSAEQIPKQKLGEDFVTDFVLITHNDQGPTYTMVEIERASHRVLYK
jgi:hypothetical protein